MFIQAFLTTLLYQNQLIMTKTDYASYLSKKLKKRWQEQRKRSCSWKILS